MSLQATMFRLLAGQSDKKRDAAIPLPVGVTECRNISYGSYGDSSLLDVYCPEGAAEALPTIVSIHGGGYVYGNKEIYRRYCMDLARRGFTVINFNYRLAPKWRFPAPIADTVSVLHWAVTNAERYRIDPDRLFLVGDSAGAQLASQIAAIFTNPSYAELFGMKLPQVNLRAVGLNCGMYDMKARAGEKRTGLNLDYLGKELPGSDPRLAVLENITAAYPAAYITTACHDFLRSEAEPMYRFLADRGIPCQWKCYGTEADRHIAHVFHVNILLPEAIACNDETAAFFRQYMD